MKDIKFKVYFEAKINEKIIKGIEEPCSWFLLTQTGKLWSYGPTRPSQPLGKEYIKAILLFFTGLKDRNGKEIYEGDVICNMRYSPQEQIVKWGEGKYEGIWNYKEAEVIGNIYENPELIKNK